MFQKPKFLGDHQLPIMIVLFLPLILEIYHIIEVNQEIVHYDVIEPNYFFVMSIIIYQLITGILGYYPLTQKNHVIYTTINRLILFIGLLTASSRSYLIGGMSLHNSISQYLMPIAIYETIIVIKQIGPIMMDYRRLDRFILIKNLIFLSIVLIWQKFLLFRIGTAQEHPVTINRVCSDVPYYLLISNPQRSSLIYPHFLLIELLQHQHLIDDMQ